jgi:hypothetical protein
LITALVAAALIFSAAPAAAATGCFSKPSACGYPDATTAGVPAGTALTTVSSVTLSSGQTLEGKTVTNGVRVTGPNVTIRNSVIKTPSGGNGNTAIELANGATNFTIEHSEVTGNGSKTNAPESNVWNHYNNAGFKVIDSYLHGVPDNIEGSVAEVRDSFIAVDAEYSGAHSENIYLCGASAKVVHSTLYNFSDETSLIFGDGICGKGNTVTVEDSMLAGGGYMLQPNAKGVSAPVRIVDNRVGRCLTTARQDSGGGYVCASGADANGYWPRGGHYGLDTELGKEAVWSGNVWDDNSAAMCASEKAGCAGEQNGGGVTPPTEEPKTPPKEEPTTPPKEEPKTPPEEEPPAEEPTQPTEPPEEPTTEEPTEPSEPPSEPSEPSEPTPPTESHKPHRPHRPTRPPKPPEQPSEPSKPSEEGGSAPSGGESTPTLPSLPTVEETATSVVEDLGHTSAIWNVPRARAGGPAVTLDGTGSTGSDGPVTCIWTVEGPTGKTIARKTGCVVHYRFTHAGLAHVSLLVRAADGTTDRSTKTILVRSRQSGQPRVARAARAFD